MINIIVKITEAIKKINNACVADLFAISWFFAPINLEMLLVAPFPSPTLAPFNTMKIGVTNPIPAIAVGPSPATHIPSTMLYNAVKIIEIMIGIANFFTAFSGSPLINSTFLLAIVLILINLIFIIGDDLDYEAIIKEKFPNCAAEVITPDVFEIETLVEYITDDIVVYKPFSVMVHRHFIRFMMDVGKQGKIYYLDGFSDEDLKIVHAGLLKFTWKSDVKINLFKNANPDKDILGL